MGQDGRTRPSSQPPPERALYRFLALYRYFSFMLGVGLVLVLPQLRGLRPLLEEYVAVGAVGSYVVFRAVIPRFPQPGTIVGNLSLGVDIALALGAVLITGGLHSGLLLYSFVPVLTISLLMEERVAYLMAGISLLTLLIAHSAFPAFSWIGQADNPLLFLLYTVALIQIAFVPYHTNLNLRRRLMREAIIGERRRLRREIHDSLAQEMAFLNLKAKEIRDSLASSTAGDTAQKMTDLQQSLQDTYGEMREYLDSLSLSEDFSLLPSLEELCQEFTARTGIPLSCDSEPSRGGLGLSPLAEVHLIRIVQEALSNIRKHSHARQVWLRLRATPTAVELEIRDDGLGFEPQDVPQGHYGLMMIQERAREVGATLTISSAPGQGTLLRVLFPR